MVDLFYPQLASGAVVQYPFRKTRTVRTVKNILSDGSLILLPDWNSAKLVWQLDYADLTFADVQLIQSHFQACSGPLRGFTFIDPDGNMFASSGDFTAVAWQKPSSLLSKTGASDPFAGTEALNVTNYGQTIQEVKQSVRVPSNYQYCFSLYAKANQLTSLTLFRRGTNTQESTAFIVGPSWSRLVSTGRLDDSGSVLTAGVAFAAGQQIELYGMQLEAQISPSRYQCTSVTGGVYQNAYWGIESLEITAMDVNSYATSVIVEAAV